ncbi:DoxX family protein [Leptospira kmetyi]|uniref:DoxX family protein n=1 Tax=Leptospira kmetyi TaxID=408139 RepID=A0AAD0XMW6_9LEPT|nr:DoxX family protein [Leptospira kmetyi]AYV54055.1 DoxX family protein [Leptospira kmetyi]AYV57303.1 DoxX family protein [Leptospira kmetyi]EQA55139.1 DoxX family protein [Leptospira kmetyi serovar Malaysia str. Bejo-Iso9]PJZ28494.1 DoxX family protein [Leptospira kmetyi]TGL68373.1 DoxX family protein [Leptospira kmetyi]
MIDKFFQTETSWILTSIRIALGVVMLPHGAQKLLGWFGGFGFSATMGFFTSQGIPSLFAFLVIVAEFFGALGLIFGFCTKLSALGIGLTMLGAAIFVREHGFFMNWFGTQGGEGFEYHILAIAMSVALLIGGGGAFSLDALIADKLK